MAATEKKLYPYLGANHLYGYADTAGRVVIQPEYSHVGFFHNGLALVRKEGEKEMLVNTANEVISMPRDYDELRLHPIANHVFVETTKFYANRWRFWEWKFLPGFDIIGGGSSDSRLFDTEVAREKRTLYWWDGEKKVKTKKGPRYGGKTIFYLDGMGDGIVQVDHELYRLAGNVSNKLARGVEPYRAVDGGYLMQQGAGGYRLIDRYGKRISNATYKPVSEWALQVGGAAFPLKAQVNYSMPGKRVEIYVDDKGKAFIYPDLEKEFPTHIQAYHLADTVSAEDILSQAQQIAPIPQTDRFIFVLDFGRRVYVMDRQGVWHDPRENYSDFRVVSRGVAAVLWPPKVYFAGGAPLPAGWDVRSIVELGYSQGLFRIVIGLESGTRVGVWDSNAQEWILEPDCYAMNHWGHSPPYVAFQLEEEGKWGFFDLENRRVHIPPTYDSVQGNGWVTIDDGTNRPAFFLDIGSRREFRAQ